MNISEDQLASWSKPVSNTEDDKCKKAISDITTCLRGKFGNQVSIFLQGSYKNNTNVRRDSDVDIVLRHDGYYYYDLQRLLESDKVIFESKRDRGDYTYHQLKKDVENALVASFGKDVERKNKCIKVKGDDKRITADIVPCFVHKRFATLTAVEVEGIQFYTDAHQKIISFPEQHYDKGTKKTERTGRMYKRIVRILKVIRNTMVDKQIISDDLVSSFFIESLVYNVPDNLFIPGQYVQSLKNIITKVYNDMGNEHVSSEYVEVSGYKWLFKGTGRPPENAKNFMLGCWQFAGFNI